MGLAHYFRGSVHYHHGEEHGSMHGAGAVISFYKGGEGEEKVEGGPGMGF